MTYLCSGLCMHASDIGVSVAGDPVAYAHPACLEHGHVDWCKDCEGWGNFAGRPIEETRLICPMCNGTGRVVRPADVE